MSILEPSTTSGLITVSTTVIISKPALLTSLILNPGSAASSVVCYDNATAGSGTVLAELEGVANGASITFTPISAIQASAGITIVVAGTSATATLAYQRSN